jgi:hypothetical protein
MIAHRFRPLVWVAGCAVATTALYTVSLSVAAERTRLEEMDRQIASTQNDIRKLQTEFGTRASLRQLERWNSEALALAAPSAGQFRVSEEALASINGDALPTATAAPPAMVAATTRPEPAAITTASAEGAAQKRDQATRPDKRAAESKHSVGKPQRLAMLDRKLVDPAAGPELYARPETDGPAAIGKGKSVP